jgi:hypothetical protein
MSGVVVVNVADWAPPVEVPEGFMVANAPRPIAGELTWTGDFRHGIFYAAHPADRDGILDSWGADDAWPVEFIDNAEIMRRVLAKLAEHGYASVEAAAAEAIEVGDVVAMMQLPWHGDA